MEINANVSNAVSASISKLNINTAHRKIDNQKPEKSEENKRIIEESANIKTEELSEKMAVDVEDIKKYAKYMGENLSIDDINYGLMYGRSVIADYSI